MSSLYVDQPGDCLPKIVRIAGYSPAVVVMESNLSKIFDDYGTPKLRDRAQLMVVESARHAIEISVQQVDFG